MLRRFVRRLLFSMAGRQDDERLREELQAHLQMQAAENERAGMPPDHARRRAVLELGSIEAIRSRYHDEQGIPGIDDLLQDVRYTFRQLRKSPLFALTATLSLAMGIGANAAVFTIVERVLLRPLPVAQPHELVQVTDERILTQPGPRFSYPFYAVLRDNDVLSGLAARFALGLNLTVNGQTVRANGELVSGTYFDVVGVAASSGRLLSAADDRTPGAHPVAVISARFQRRTFAGDPSLAGRQVLVNDRPFAIVGVAPERFTGTDPGGSTDIWIPLAMQRDAGRDLLTDTRTNWLDMIGRLRPGMTREAAAGGLDRYLRQRASELPAEAALRSLVLLPAGRGISPLRRELGSALLMLSALTAVALALACVNVACLAAVRSAAREKEIAIRLALGARASRLTQQLLTEGLVLAVLGGAAGLLIAPWLARSLAAIGATPLEIDAGLDPRVLGFLVVVSLLTGVLIALVPIVAARRVKFAHTADRPWTAPGAASRRPGAHDLIVAVQIAMALAMLITSALLVQSLRGLRSVDPGFRADDLLLVSLDAAGGGYDSSSIDGFWRATLERIRQIPGVGRASLAGTVPLAPGRQRQPWVMPGGEQIELDTNFVGPGYFDTLGIPLLSGREFTDADRRGAQPVVIVNQRLADMFWPQQDPIGKPVRLPDAGKPLARVIGVVRDAKYRDLRGEAGPMFYRPVLQTRSTDAMTLHLRVSGDADATVRAVRLAVQSINRNVPLFRVTTLAAQLDASFGQTRQAAMLTGAFGVLALLLSGVGVYGVTALAVSRRTRDIGIRVALGAPPSHIVRAVGIRALAIVAAGLLLGVLASLGVTRVTGTLLFGITPGDGATLASMAGLLAAVCLLAFAIPLRTALRLDALTAIRHD